MITDNHVQDNVDSLNGANVNCVPYAPWPVASSCKCDRGFHNNIEIKDLGQYAWAKVSKQQLSQIDIQLLDNRCQDLLQFMAQQTQDTGFIPLSPLQFEEISQCDKCIHDPELCKDPVKLYNLVNSCQQLKGTGTGISHYSCVTGSQWILRVLMGISSRVRIGIPQRCNFLTTLRLTCMMRYSIKLFTVPSKVNLLGKLHTFHPLLLVANKTVINIVLS